MNFLKELRDAFFESLYPSNCHNFLALSDVFTVNEVDYYYAADFRLIERDEDLEEVRENRTLPLSSEAKIFLFNVAENEYAEIGTLTFYKEYLCIETDSGDYGSVFPSREHFRVWSKVALDNCSNLTIQNTLLFRKIKRRIETISELGKDVKEECLRVLTEEDLIFEEYKDANGELCIVDERASRFLTEVNILLKFIKEWCFDDADEITEDMKIDHYLIQQLNETFFDKGFVLKCIWKDGKLVDIHMLLPEITITKLCNHNNWG